MSPEDGGRIGRMPRPLMEDNAAFRFRYSSPNRHLYCFSNNLFYSLIYFLDILFRIVNYYYDL